MQMERRDQQRGAGFAELIEYIAVVAPGVALLKNDSFLAALEIHGPDMDRLLETVRAALHSRVADVFNLGAGWAVQTDMTREETHDYPESGHQMNPASILIDEERRAQFQLTGKSSPYRSRYFWCFTWQPPKGLGRKAEAWVFNETDGRKGAAARHLERFEARMAAADSLCKYRPNGVS
jgi:type IV secretory pathway VirB4 component